MRQFIQLWLLPSLVAGFQISDTNFTIAFFANDQRASCNDGDVSAAPALSTYAVPEISACFNVDDAFSHSNTSTGIASDDTQDPRVSWTSFNAKDYDTKANYSRLWFHSVNQTGDIGEGKPGTWALNVYAGEDCLQADAGQDPEDTPWFDTSCQTSDDGLCVAAPDSIKSFALLPGSTWNDGDHCDTWAEESVAAGLDTRSASIVAIISIGLTALLLA